MAPAVKDSGEGAVGVPNGQPATLGNVEIATVAVVAVQRYASARAGPGAAVPVTVKVQIGGQLIAEAAGIGAAMGIGTLAVNEAGAGQVVADIVQLRQGADLDEAIAIGIGNPQHGQGQLGWRGIGAGGIGGGDLVLGLGHDLGGGAGYLAAGMAVIIAGGDGNRQPGGQVGLNPAPGQGAVTIVDEDDLKVIDTLVGCAGSSDISQIG